MRKLRSIQSLKSFEAAARHLSFKRAAEELFVTPTAISHQVKTLENQLNCRLFERKTRQIQLTQQGFELFSELRKSFDSIDNTLTRIESRINRETVTLGLGSIIGTRWLAPRLGSFWEQHDDIDLRLHHSSYADFENLDHFDLAIAWGQGNWPGMQVHKFIRIQLTPVMSPELKAPGSVNKLLDFPLLDTRERVGWQQWFTAADTIVNHAPASTVIDDANLVLQAALDGQGVALGILPFVEDDLSQGRLIRPFELTIEPDEAYHLIYRKKALSNPAIKTVRDWLLDQIVPEN